MEFISLYLTDNEGMAPAVYATEYSISQLTANQIDLMNEISVLAPIEEIINSISLITPFITILCKKTTEP